MRFLPLVLLSACVIDTSIIKGADDTGSCEPVVRYLDEDGDGFGAGEPLASCVPEDSLVSVDGDCDDNNADISPAATEQCNGVDDDCDGSIDDGAEGLGTWYEDQDQDGYGGAPVSACEQPEGSLVTAGDCDDNNAGINPEMQELCDGVDQDCDGETDEDAEDQDTWYYDGDGDGFGVESPTATACTQPSGYTDNDDDCDDSDAALSTDCGAEGLPTPSALCTGGYSAYLYTDSAATEPELNLIGVYEGDSSTGSPPKITVDVDRRSHMVLHLSAYEPVEWTVNNLAGATIDEILVSGYNNQLVNAPSGVPVTIRTYTSTGSNFGYWCGYSLPYNYGGCDTDLLIKGVEAYTGLTMASFAGCYQARSFKIE